MSFFLSAGPTLYWRAEGSNCLEYRVSVASPLPADVVQRLLRSPYRWAWESHLLRDYNLSRTSLPQHRPLTELNAQSAESFLADVAEIFDDEHRFIVLVGYRTDGPLVFHDELKRFCAAQESRIAYVLVHDGDTACLYLHFVGKLDEHRVVFNEWFGVTLKEGSPLPERPYRKLGVVTLESVQKITTELEAKPGIRPKLL